MLDVGCWMLDGNAGCSIPGAQWRKIGCGRGKVTSMLWATKDLLLEVKRPNVNNHEQCRDVAP